MGSNEKGCCYECPDRKPGCHNIETCEKWKKHEEDKKERYEKEKLAADIDLTDQMRHFKISYYRQHKRKH